MEIEKSGDLIFRLFILVIGGSCLFLYKFNYTNDEKNLCKMEIKYLFNHDVKESKKYFFTEQFVEVNRSPFINVAIDIKIVEDTYDDLLKKIKLDKVHYENFKVKYVNIDKSMEYSERIRLERTVGEVIEGEAKIHEPNITIAITNLDDKWILGELHKNQNPWYEHNKKPYQYCNAISTKVSRSIINIAASNIESPKLVDPCCGIGTVVVEGLSMGFNIEGYDINSNIVERARCNLEFFGYDDVIKCSDISNINKHYDVAIIDLPYGILSPTTRDIQMNIINNASRIANRAVILSSFDMKDCFIKAGFSIEDECLLNKGTKFTRYITICKK